MVIFGGLWTNSAYPDHHSSSYSESNDVCCDDRENGIDEDNDVDIEGLEAVRPRTRSRTRTRTWTGDYGSIARDPVEDETPSFTSEFSNFDVFGGGDMMRLCGTYMAIYIGIAIIAYSFVFERWTIIDSIYFAASTFTTCGYGDLEPTTQAGQIFTIFFAIYGVLILGVYIGIVGHSISEAQAKAVQKLKRMGHEAMLQTMLPDSEDDQVPIELSARQGGFLGDHVTLLDDIKRVVRAELPEILVVAVAALFLGWREGWSITSTAYFCIMAATTTGFGDYTPHSQIDKLYCVFFLPLAVAVFGEVLGRIATVYIQRKTRSAEKKFLRRSITSCDVRKMDLNDDGMVDMGEFLTFMLVALQKVDKKFMNDLRVIFHSLDTNDNGMIDRDDLDELARRMKELNRQMTPDK